MRLWHSLSAAFVCAIWANLRCSASSSFLRREGPKDALKEFEVEESAKAYMHGWEESRGWESTRLGRLCETKNLPNATHALVASICGADADRDRCVCNVAKAHACHVGCAADHFMRCPEECHDKHCKAGAPFNGGKDMSAGGNTGTCYNYCSMYHGPFRWCGTGEAYKTGVFLDCTRCDPANTKRMPSPEEKKDMWLTCMADCFPSPSCAKMCAEGTPECFAECVETYKHGVEPYWDSLHASSVNVLDVFTKEGSEESSEPVSTIEATSADVLHFLGKEASQQILPSKARNASVENATHKDAVHTEGDAIDDFMREGQSVDFMLRNSAHAITMQKAKSLGLVD